MIVSPMEALGRKDVNVHWSDQIGMDHAKYFKTISDKYAILRKMAGDVVDPSDTNKINLVG